MDSISRVKFSKNGKKWTPKLISDFVVSDDLREVGRGWGGGGGNRGYREHSKSQVNDPGSVLVRGGSTLLRVCLH